MKEYRFQDYILLRVETHGQRQFEKYLNNEYDRMTRTNVSKDEPKYLIDLEIVDKIPSDLPKDAIVRKDKFKKLFNFEFAIVGIGSKKVKIYFKNHWVSKVYVTAIGVYLQAHVIEPTMYLSFLNQGIFFMHSAGVSKDGKAYVMPAYGGTGKTTTSMSLINKGYDFLGDDLLIIDPKKKIVFPYPRPLHIFTYNVRNLQGAKIPFKITAIIYFKNVLRFFLEKLLGIEFLISTRVNADEILPNFKLSKPAKLHNVIFLKKKGDAETIKLDSSKKINKHANNIVVSADLNVSLFNLITDHSEQKEIHAQELKVAAQMLESADYFGYLNTRKIDLGEITKYVENVEA